MPLRRISLIKAGAAYFLGWGKIVIFTHGLILNGSVAFLMNARTRVWKKTKQMRRSFLTAKSSVWSREANMGSLQLPYVFGLHGLNMWTSEVWNRVHHDRVRLHYFTVMHRWLFKSCCTGLGVISSDQDFRLNLLSPNNTTNSTPNKKRLKHIWVYISRPHPASSSLHNLGNWLQILIINTF